MRRPPKNALTKINLFILDMDGTVHIGGRLFPFARTFFEEVKKAGKEYVFLTNNSSKSAVEYEIMLKNMGIENPRVFTSGEATALYIKENFPGKSTYILGTESLRKTFQSMGIKVTEENPEVLVLGYDTSITYEKIRKFALFLRKGLPYIATHPDINCPSPEGLIPDAGSFISLFEKSTGRTPDVIVGKPNPEMLYEIAKVFKLSTSEIAVIGDRLYTDMEMAKRAGALPILVLSGETSREEAEKQPDIFFVENLGDIAKLLKR